MKNYTADEVMEVLRKEAKKLGQKQAAASLGFSPQFICDVLKGKRKLTAKLSLALGFIDIGKRYIKAEKETA